MASTVSLVEMSPVCKMNLTFDQDSSPKATRTMLSFEDESEDDFSLSSSVPMMMDFDEEDDDECAFTCSSPARSESADSGFSSDVSMDYSFGQEDNISETPTEEDIKDALNRAENAGDLVADFSTPYNLPTVQGKHNDLTAISPNTVASLLQGNHDDLQVTIIDCRYPYEYEGGHITGAKNLYTRDMIDQEFLQGKNPLTGVQGSKKQVLIFHCEFSSERGPKMLRHLREQDRALNSQAYPALHYPEMYILEGGYKAFWEKCNEDDQVEMCQPQGYMLMLDEEFTEELKVYRRESTSSKGGVKIGRKSGRSKSRIFL